MTSDPRDLARAATRAIDLARGTTRDRRERLTSWYVAVLGVVSLGAMALSVVTQVLDPASCAVAACATPGGRALLSTGIAAVGLGAILWASSVCGPVGAGAAHRAWVLASPADRRALLEPRLRVALLVGAAGGAASGLVAALAVSSPTVGGLLVPVALGTLVGSVGVVLTATAQPHRSGERIWGLVGRGLVVVGASCLVAASWGASGPVLTADQPSTRLVLGVVFTTTVLALVALLRVSRAGLTDVPDAELRRGGEVVESLTASAALLDGTSARLLAETRRAARHGRVTSTQGRGSGRAALLARDTRRIVRRPGRLVGTGLLVPLVALGASSFGVGTTVVATALASCVLARSTAGSFVSWTTSTGLRRWFPGPDTTVRLTLLVGPLTVTALWCLAAVLLAGLPWWLSAGPVLAAGCHVIRSADGGDPADVGPFLVTSAGLVPLGVVRRLLLGLDVAVLAVLPLAVLPDPVALLVPVGALGWLLLRAR